MIGLPKRTGQHGSGLAKVEQCGSNRKAAGTLFGGVGVRLQVDVHSTTPGIAGIARVLLQTTKLKANN